jgi:hypothetical protein
MPNPESHLSDLIFAVLLAVPLTVYLGAPPVWSHSLAQTECEQLVVDRLAGTPASAHASWNFLPTAHWICEYNGRPAADFGWWVTDTSNVNATLLD